MMNKEEFEKAKQDIIDGLMELEYKEINIPGLDVVGLDISDIGNHIGISIGDFIVENDLDKEDFIHGIKHGISLKDGTH